MKLSLIIDIVQIQVRYSSSVNEAISTNNCLYIYTHIPIIGIKYTLQLYIVRSNTRQKYLYNFYCLFFKHIFFNLQIADK